MCRKTILLITAAGLLHLLCLGTLRAQSPHSRNRLKDGVMIDSLVVHKAARQMIVFHNQKELKTYRIHLGLNPTGAKQYQGDYKTPEGLYYINSKNANSEYHKSLGVSYPNAADIQRAKKMGKKPGGDILIHGLPLGAENLGPNRYQNDWTWGCIAVTDAEIDELYEHIKTGIPILITP